MESNLTIVNILLSMVDVLRKESAYTFDETVKRAEEALSGEGFGLLLTKGIEEIFKQKLGIDYPRYTTILACAPELAKMGLDASKDVGTLYPCSFVVYEDDGKVMISHTSIMSAASELGLASEDAMTPVIEETGRRVRIVWDKI